MSFSTASTRSMSARIILPARTSTSALAVSTMSELVQPRWMKRADPPTFSSTAVKKAMTSWRVFSSTSRMRATSKPALARISAMSASGMTPSLDQASHTASSTSSQEAKRASMVHNAAISGRE